TAEEMIKPKHRWQRKPGDPPKANGQPAAPEIIDAFRNEVPKKRRGAWCDPWLQEPLDFLVVMSEKLRQQRISDGMRKRANYLPFFKEKDVVDGVGFLIQYLDDLITHFKEQRPAGVCPACGGEAAAAAATAALCRGSCTSNWRRKQRRRRSERPLTVI